MPMAVGVVAVVSKVDDGICMTRTDGRRCGGTDVKSG